MKDGVLDVAGLNCDDRSLSFDRWEFGHSLTSPHGIFGDFLKESYGSEIDLEIQVTEGRLYFVPSDGKRQFQFYVSPKEIVFLKLNPRETVRILHDFSAAPQTLQMSLQRGRIGISINKQLAATETTGDGASTEENSLRLVAKDKQELPSAEINSIRVRSNKPDRPVSENEQPIRPMRSKHSNGGPLTIEVGPIRTALRGARSPLLTTFSDGSLLLTAGSRTGGSQRSAHSTRENFGVPSQPLLQSSILWN